MAEVKGRRRLRKNGKVTIHQCVICGRVEGERPGSCCPGCGTQDEPFVIEARVETIRRCD